MKIQVKKRFKTYLILSVSSFLFISCGGGPSYSSSINSTIEKPLLTATTGILNEPVKEAPTIKDDLVTDDQKLKYILLTMINKISDISSADFLSVLNTKISNSTKNTDSSKYIELDEILQSLVSNYPNYKNILDQYTIKIYSNNLQAVLDEKGQISIKVKVINKTQDNSQEESYVLKISNFKSAARIWGKKFTHEEMKFIGNKEKSYLDKSAGLMSDYNIKPYNLNFVYKAYLGAGGIYYINKEAAQKSFIQDYKVKKKFVFDLQDGEQLNSENLSKMADTLEEAKSRKFLNDYSEKEIIFYEFVINNQKYRINPLNNEDIEKFKSLLISNIRSNSSDINYKLLIKTNETKNQWEDSKELYEYLKIPKNQMSTKIQNYFQNLSSEASKKYDFGIKLSVPNDSLTPREKNQDFNNRKLSNFFEVKTEGAQSYVKYNDFVNELNKLDSVTEFKKNFNEIQNNLEKSKVDSYTKETLNQFMIDIFKREFYNFHGIVHEMYKSTTQRISNNSWESKSNILGQKIKINYKKNLDFLKISKDKFVNDSDILNKTRKYFDFGTNGDNSYVFANKSVHDEHVQMTSDELYVLNHWQGSQEDLTGSMDSAMFYSKNSNNVSSSTHINPVGGSSTRRSRMEAIFDSSDSNWRSKVIGDQKIPSRLRDGYGLWDTGRLSSDQRRVWLNGSVQVKFDGQNIDKNQEVDKINGQIYKYFGLNENGTAVVISSTAYQNFLKAFAYKNKSQEEIKFLTEQESFNDVYKKNYLVFAKKVSDLHIKLIQKTKKDFKLGNIDKTNFVEFKKAFEELTTSLSDLKFDFSLEEVHNVITIKKNIKSDKIKATISYNDSSVFEIDKSEFQKLDDDERTQDFDSKIRSLISQIEKSNLTNISNKVFKDQNLKEIVKFSDGHFKMGSNKLLFHNKNYEEETSLSSSISINGENSNNVLLDKTNQRISYFRNNWKSNSTKQINNFLVLYDKNSFDSLLSKMGKMLVKKDSELEYDDIPLSNISFTTEHNFFSNLLDKNIVKNNILDRLSNAKKITYYVEETTNKPIGTYISELYDVDSQNIALKNAISSVVLQDITDHILYKEEDQTNPELMDNTVFNVVKVTLEDGQILYFDSIESLNKYSK